MPSANLPPYSSNMAKKTPAPSLKSKKTVKKTAKKAPAKKKTTITKKNAPTKKKTPVKKAAAKKTASAKKKTVTKKTAPKSTAKTKAKKKAASKKPAAKKAVTKKSVKKTPAKKTTAKKTAVKKAPAKKTTAKKTAVKKVPAKKTAPAKKKTATKTAKAKAAEPKAAKKAATKTAKRAGKSALLKSRIGGKAKATKPAGIGFSLDDVKEIAKQSAADEAAGAKKKADHAKEKAADIEAQLKAAKPSKVGAASLADILGFNPAASKRSSAYDDPATVPAKWRKYFKLLLELRTHLTGQIDQHSEETLKRSSKDDAGDLSSYGQHMADAGTDTFDRDFALSLVANEQEALAEIEAAITRIKNGTYGVCEVTGEPIDKARLAAVPFTRYSASAQKELERHRHRVRTQAGLGAEAGDTVAIADPNSDE